MGEAIDFDFFLPNGAVSNDLVVFERYLERAEPGGAFSADGGLSWLDGVEPHALPLEIVGDRGSLTYRPAQPGSYLARWRVGGETLYRYFAVIEDDWLVVRFSTGVELDPHPNLHATGIPLDYRLPVVRVDRTRMSYAGESGRFDAGDPVFQALLGHHRLYGDAVIPQLPDTPDMDVERRAEYYGGLLEVAGGLLPDPDTVRSARVSMRHPLDTGYTKTFAHLGVNDHCGLEEANTAPWLGMPEFPYFSSPLDCRKVDQGRAGEVVAHQWDFCGGWHFLGPAVWHREMSAGRWDDTERCIRQGVAEALNASRLSGHPVFLYPLYDGLYERGQAEFDWAERLQGLLAFRLTKERPLAFARSLDIADYFRRHFPVTPTTVFVSATDHLEYDRHWLVGWNNHGVGVTQDRLAWDTRSSDLRVASRSGPVAHLHPSFGRSAYPAYSRTPSPPSTSSWRTSAGRSASSGLAPCPSGTSTTPTGTTDRTAAASPTPSRPTSASTHPSGHGPATACRPSCRWHRRPRSPTTPSRYGPCRTTMTRLHGESRPAPTDTSWPATPTASTTWSSCSTWSRETRP